jgi:hypothetical protein
LIYWTANIARPTRSVATSGVATKAFLPRDAPHVALDQGAVAVSHPGIVL